MSELIQEFWPAVIGALGLLLGLMVSGLRLLGGWGDPRYASRSDTEARLVALRSDISHIQERVDSLEESRRHDARALTETMRQVLDRLARIEERLAAR